LIKEKWKLSIRTWGISTTVRQLMGCGVHWKNKWEEEEGLIVRELDRRMVAEEWLVGEEDMMKGRRVTGRESATYISVSKYSIAPALTAANSVPADHPSK
jgi:hypothetical protein